MVKAKILLAHRYNLQVSVYLQCKRATQYCRRLHSIEVVLLAVCMLAYVKPVGLQVCRMLDVCYVFFRHARPNVSMDLLCV